MVVRRSLWGSISTARGGRVGRVARLVRLLQVGIALAALVIGAYALSDAYRLLGNARVGAMSTGVVARDPLLRGLEELRPYDLVQQIRCCGDASFKRYSTSIAIPPGSQADLRIVRAGERFVHPIEPETWTATRVVLGLGPPFAAGFLLLVTTALGVLGLQQLTAFDINWTHRFERIHVAALTLIPVLLFHIALVFPKPARIFEEIPGVISPIYLLAALALVVEQLLFGIFQERWILFSRIRELSTLLIGAILLARTLGALGQTRDPAELHRARILAYGVAFAFGLPLLAFGVDMAAPSNLVGAVLPFSYGAIAISLGLAVGRSDLLNLEAQYRRLLVPAAITAVSILGLFLIQIGIFRALGFERPLEAPGFAIAFVAVLALLLDALRRLATAGLERLVPSVERRYRRFLERAADLDPIAQGPRETAEFICEFVRDELGPTFVAFLAPDPATRRLRVSCAVGAVPPSIADLDLALGSEAGSRLLASRTYIAGPELDPDTRRFWSAAGLGEIELAFPIQIEQRPAGALVVGAGRRAYGRGELELLDILAQFAALALQQARRFESLENDLKARSSDLARALEHVQSMGRSPPLLPEDETRFAWVGKLASGIAHEANKPLYVIEHHLDRLRREPRLDRARVHSILVELDRVRRLIGDLQAYGRSHTGDVRSVELGTILDEALSAAPDRLQVSMEGDLTLRARVDSAIGARLFGALLQNAAEVGAESVVIHVSRTDDGLRILISDDGPGVDEQIREQIFEPFFSTHRVESASGLGLAIARQMARAHGGSLDLVPSGRGASFELVLP
jgi:signal transduction histidine kinase